MFSSRLKNVMGANIPFSLTTTGGACAEFTFSVSPFQIHSFNHCFEPIIHRVSHSLLHFLFSVERYFIFQVLLSPCSALLDQTALHIPSNSTTKLRPTSLPTRSFTDHNKCYFKLAIWEAGNIFYVYSRRLRITLLCGSLLIMHRCLLPLRCKQGMLNNMHERSEALIVFLLG